MRVLFDQGTPVPLRQALPSRFEIATAFELGWSSLSNGQLLDAADTEGFDVMVTTDRNLRHQQNLAGRHIAAVVLSVASWPRIRRVVPEIARAIDECASGTLVEVMVP